MASQETVIKVRFNEIDAYKVAWHGHFVAWMEVGRNEIASRFGLSADQLAEAGFMGPVVNLEIKYLRPARLDDQVTILTTARRMQTATLEFQSTVVGPDNRPCARGVTVHAVTDLEGVIQYKLPETIEERVEKMLQWCELP